MKNDLIIVKDGNLRDFFQALKGDYKAIIYKGGICSCIIGHSSCRSVRNAIVKSKAKIIGCGVCEGEDDLIENAGKFHVYPHEINWNKKVDYEGIVEKAIKTRLRREALKIISSTIGGVERRALDFLTLETFSSNLRHMVKNNKIMVVRNISFYSEEKQTGRDYLLKTRMINSSHMYFEGVILGKCNNNEEIEIFGKLTMKTNFPLKGDVIKVFSEQLNPYGIYISEGGEMHINVSGKIVEREWMTDGTWYAERSDPKINYSIHSYLQDSREMGEKIIKLLDEYDKIPEKMKDVLF